MDYGDGDNETADQVCVWLLRGGRGLSLQPIGCTPALSVTQKRRCSCSCSLLR